MRKSSRPPDWSRVFEEPVVEARWIDAGYENANDIWEVRTGKGEFVVKILRAAGCRTRDPFWRGLCALFGLEPWRHIEKAPGLADLINRYSRVKVPIVRDVDTTRSRVDRPYVVMEKAVGGPAHLEKPEHTVNLARDLGEHLGGLHRATFDYWGVFEGAPRYSPEEWPKRLAEAIDRLSADRFRARGVPEEARRYSRTAQELPPPDHLSLVFPDLRPSQFLHHSGRLAALVDIESIVVGPRELDLVAAEYSIAPEHVGAFVEGYEKHLPMPNLSAIRGVYRFAYYLIDVLGEPDLEEWMSHGIRFSDNGASERCGDQAA